LVRDCALNPNFGFSLIFCIPPSLSNLLHALWMEKLKFKMSRSRGTAAVAAPNDTSFGRKPSQNTTGEATASSKKAITPCHTKNQQRFSIQADKPIQKSPNSQQQSDGRMPTNGHGLFRLKNFFKRSLLRSGTDPKQGLPGSKHDTKSNANEGSTSNESKVAAYVPSHAAADYSKTALPVTTANEDSIVRSLVQSSQKDTISFQPIHKSNEVGASASTDYEKLIETEKQATTQAALNRLSKGTLPDAPLNIPASSYATRRENRMSTLSAASSKGQHSSKHSLKSSVLDNRIPEWQQTAQLGPSGSLLMKVSEYIKPPRPESMQSMHSHGRIGSVGSLGMNMGETRNKRWSTATSRTPEEH